MDTVIENQILVNPVLLASDSWLLTSFLMINIQNPHFRLRDIDDDFR
jgi:hypothetical protein